MKNLLWIFVFLFSTQVHAYSSRFSGFNSGQQAVSLFLGSPTFLRYDYWHNWKKVYFFDGGYHFDKYVFAGANIAFYNYKIRDRYLEKSLWNSLFLYYGGGAHLGLLMDSDKNEDDVLMGIRAFGGVEYLFDGERYGLRAEVGPALYFQGADDLEIQGMLGLTYYFDHAKKSHYKKRRYKKRRYKKRSKRHRRQKKSKVKRVKVDFEGF